MAGVNMHVLVSFVPTAAHIGFIGTCTLGLLFAAVRQNGDALWHASGALRDDKSVVLAAVSQDGGALQHASATLRDEREVVRRCLTCTTWEPGPGQKR